ncbi:MAG: ABC transporter ATP-binding protein, partial [Clostridiales bacterium]|nr:ABC transporter ATP-binding protein [Clostridiales bacterium]
MKMDRNQLKSLGRVMSYTLKNYKWSCLIVVICILVTALTTLAATLFMQTLIDDYITPLTQAANPDFGPLAQALVGLSAILVVGVLCSYARSRIMVNVSQGTLKRLREDLFVNMESLPIKYFDTHAHGDIMSVYTNDVDTMRQVISQSMPQLINSAITLVSTFVSMVVLSIPLTLVSVAMVVVMLLVSTRLSGQSGRYFAKQQKDLGTVNGYIEEMMQGQKVVKVFCHEDRSLNQFRELNDQLRDSANNANRIANIMMPINSNLGNISYVLCAVVGAALALNGNFGLTIGTLVSFLTLNKSFSQPIAQISQQLGSIVMASAGADRAFSLLDAQPEADNGYVELVNAKENSDGTLTETPEKTGVWAWKHFHKADGTTTYVRLEGDVTFDGVDFGYNDDKMVLHDIRMYATPGQKIAFVGSTGAGKTTITNLINRFYDIQDG